MRLFRSLCDRFLNSSRADFTSSELGSDLVELTAAGAGSAAGCEASVAGCEEEGTETGTEAARDADTETDTVNNKARNWVAIFFILSILVEQIYGGILQIVALHAIKRPQYKVEHIEEPFVAAVIMNKKKLLKEVKVGLLFR